MKFNLKPVVGVLAISLISISAMAQDQNIYPFKPVPKAVIAEKVLRLTEDANAIKNAFEIDRKNLNNGKTAAQPWGGSYWPLNQGMIANNYHHKTFFNFLSWKANYRNYVNRSEKQHADPYSMSEDDLAELSPAEKYDLLLGDTSFDLTNRIWDYSTRWGQSKKWGFLSSIDLPEGYRVPKGSSMMAWWEGICHGWALASGLYPRAEKTVDITLPNGKKLPFYPNDIKALVSLMFANSVLQDNVIVEGLRCKAKNPKKDKYGRYIDREPKKPGDESLPSCADVHPAVLHMTMVNVNGVQGRSFVVDHSAKASVANQPVEGYSLKYFNPKNGKKGNLPDSLIRVSDYKKDPFKSARHVGTFYILGVTMDLRYVDWETPKPKKTNFESDDKIVTQSFNYDLELDKDGNIIGGQWRTYRNGRLAPFKAVKTNQPDFLWIAPKDYMKYFKPANVEAWDPSRQTTPPASWKNAAFGAHAFTYNVTKEYGFNEKCTVIGEKRRMGVKEVPCEFKYPRPQPFIPVVNKLLELSRQ